VAIFDDVGADRSLFGHRRIVREHHVRHAAVGVARGEIAAQQPELFVRGFGGFERAGEIGVARHDLAPTAIKLESLHRHAR
jgi:hypothetical protein